MHFSIYALGKAHTLFGSLRVFLVFFLNSSNVGATDGGHRTLSVAQAVTHALCWITCCHPPRFNELATENEKWNGKPRLHCVDGRHPASKTPVGVLPWTRRSEGKRPSRWTGGQSNPHKWLASRNISNVGVFETLAAGTKPKTSQHRSPGGERRGKRKR